MRTIVPSIGSPSYMSAKELAWTLTPLAVNTTHAVKNSSTFVDRIQHIEIELQHRLVSFDLTSLVTQVPVDTALRVVEEQLTADDLLTEKTSIPVYPNWLASLKCAYIPPTFSFRTNSSSKQMVQSWVPPFHQSLPICSWNIWRNMHCKQPLYVPACGYTMSMAHLATWTKTTTPISWTPE